MISMQRLSIAAVLAVGTAGASLLISSAPSQAASLVWGFSSGNDCSGVFGQGFGNCEVNGSPVIAKFDYEKTGVEIEINSAAYPSVDGAEWSFAPEGAATGTWSYTPGAGDPGIKYWVAKGGPGFNLFYMIEGDAGSCLGAMAFTAGCLSQAITTTSGEWFTPPAPGPSGNQSGLSHLTFYNTGDDNGGNGPTVPEPGLILGLGAVGLAGAGSRLRRA
ncbi:PEP-CTERM sorting domain-containing protein [Leptolyngbya sp. PCC 6406]|uniref:PEP-CTERM sorting domain-containing protein n=1 Tax=Leptolyngbya sp. PCC 6406 TaxID=1173264 RepID=UPI0002AC43F1|nr:PEP-CTERM sorting domain-containing protein [Leptolyngbya sp. PCC 6406]